MRAVGFEMPQRFASTPWRCELSSRHFSETRLFFFFFSKNIRCNIATVLNKLDAISIIGRFHSAFCLTVFPKLSERTKAAIRSSNRGVWRNGGRMVERTNLREEEKKNFDLQTKEGGGRRVAVNSVRQLKSVTQPEQCYRIT